MHENSQTLAFVTWEGKKFDGAPHVTFLMRTFLGGPRTEQEKDARHALKLGFQTKTLLQALLKDTLFDLKPGGEGKFL